MAKKYIIDNKYCMYNKSIIILYQKKNGIKRQSSL